jgi:general secretion pathway protein I
MEPSVSDREAGFTLIELLVALAVFSLAALALLRLEGATVRMSADVATRTIGQVVAQSLAVEAVTDPAPPAFGRATGNAVNGGQTWLWTRTTARTDDARLIRIDIAVTDAARRPAGALTVVRRVQ